MIVSGPTVSVGRVHGVRRIGVWLSVLALLVVAAGGAAWWYRDHRRSERLAAQCDEVTALNEERGDEPVSHGDIEAVILGDSYAQGQYLDDPRAQAWSTLAAKRLGWTASVDAVGGTGLVSDGPCGNQSVEDRAADALTSRPDVVVVEAGLNDQPDADLGDALSGVAAAAGDAELIVVGPTTPPGYDADRAAAVDRALAAASTEVGAEYVSALDWDLAYGPDGLHMTAAGHRAYAEDFTRAIG